MAEAGVQLRWSLSRLFDFFVEPSMPLWDDKLYNGVPDTRHFVGVGVFCWEQSVGLVWGMKSCHAM